MLENFQILNDIVRVFNEQGLQDDFILIGSACEYYYQKLLPGFRANIVTDDTDILIRGYPEKSFNITEGPGVLGFT